MAIKSSTTKLLAFLFDPHETDATQVLWRSYEHLTWLLPELTPAGRRSLVAHCVREGWVRTEQVSKQTRVGLTSFGATLSKRLFPAFNDEPRSWYLLITHTPPKGDQSFRYLRNQLVTKKGAAQLTRAVYLLSSAVCDQTFLDELLATYRKGVLIVEVEKWVFGDQRELLLQHFSLSDITELLSGVSNEVDELLRLKNGFSDLNDQQKMRIFSVFARLSAVLHKEVGLCSVLEKRSLHFSEVWHRFQSLPCLQ